MEFTKQMAIPIAMAIVVIVMATAVFPFWNLLPRHITEEVKVVHVDESGCTVETSDHFIIKIGLCDGKPGETITATFDGKIKDRARAFSP